MKKFALFLLFSGLVQLAGAQNMNLMVRENNFAPVDSVTIDDNSNIILNNYHNEEILVVVEDIMGNDIYSKIIFKNQCAVLKAEDPYAKIPAGVYTVIATSRNEIFNQKIVVD